jgi:acetolactate synthase-1/2/3 large subunit
VRATILEEEPQAVQMLDAFDRCAPPDAVFAADMCIAGYWLAAFHRVRGPRKLSYPMGWGTLGYAFPAALGVATAGAGRAIAVVGDGGFLFACGELATAAQERLPLTVVIVDDGGYGMLRYDQRQANLANRGVDLATPDFTALAHAFGIEATAVEGFGAVFESTLTDYVRAPGTNVIVVSAAMAPPPSTSPRWYRRQREHQ